MSTTTTRLPLADAYCFAMDICQTLAPYCDRIQIAGSIRREKPDVGDIEIVAIPKAQFDLLNQVYRTDKDIEKAIHQAGYQFLKHGEKYKQFDLGPCKCDLFLTTPDCWGVIYTIRTGSAEFSHHLMTPRKHGGFLPSYLRVSEGRVWRIGSTIPLATPEEVDFFDRIGLKWIEPRDR